MTRVVHTRRSPLLLAVLVFAHLVAISRQVDTGAGSTLFDQVLLSALAPLMRISSAGIRGGSEAWHAYVDLRGVRDDNGRLRERVSELEALLQQKQDLVRQAERLQALLELRQTLPLQTVPAAVVSRDGTPWFRTLTLDRGSSDGIRLNAPVISSTGIVGRVIRLAAHVARVQVILDGNSGVGALIDRSRVTAVAAGQVQRADSGSDSLVLRYVPALADVVEGDVVLTSGLDRVFPKGLVIGRVKSVGHGSGLFKDILVTPAARFDVLEEVLVVLGEREPEPRFEASVQ